MIAITAEGGGGAAGMAAECVQLAGNAGIAFGDRLGRSARRPIGA
jgi:hypothetical protein